MITAETVTLQVNLGSLGTAAYATGWYRDLVSGQSYYYNAGQSQWYVYTAGMLVPLAVLMVTAPKKVNIRRGDTLRIEYNYHYEGLALAVTEYASLGSTMNAVYFEKTANSKSRTVTGPVDVSDAMQIVLPAEAALDWDDIQAKVTGGGKELGVNYQDALNIVAGKIDDVLVWSEVANNWVAPPISLPFGGYIGVSALCWNLSAVSLNLLLESTYISPAGRTTTTTRTTREALLYYDQAPNGATRLGSQGVNADESGQWRCRLRLYDSPDAILLLDEWEGIVAEVAVASQFSNFAISDFQRL